MSITLYIPNDVALPDKGEWQYRFNIKSESSNRLYVIAQHKEKKHWGCSCPSWITRRSCKHLKEMGIPTNSIPYEPRIIH
jgi:hypothetical protein